MQARFPHPPRVTKVKFHASRRAISCKNAFVIVDEGCGFFPEALSEYRLPGGEGVKRWAELQKILEWLATHHAERSTPLIVIGGGAVMDLGALAASVYRRGMPLVLVPTTLLGMVDASLGGKTSVDLDLGGNLLKNFAGTFYPAREVWICPDFLGTLPRRERLSGAGEVFKTMWIRGGKWKRDQLIHFVNTGEGNLSGLVKACLEVKSKLVARDPLDQKRIREVLNFGHTVGHALESLSKLSHGECVLWGMAVETTGKMRDECLFAIADLGLTIPAELKVLSQAEWLNVLAADKKRKGGKLEISVLASPGKIKKVRLEPAGVVKALREFVAPPTR